MTDTMPGLGKCHRCQTWVVAGDLHDCANPPPGQCRECGAPRHWKDRLERAEGIVELARAHRRIVLRHDEAMQARDWDACAILAPQLPAAWGAFVAALDASDQTSPAERLATDNTP